MSTNTNTTTVAEAKEGSVTSSNGATKSVWVYQGKRLGRGKPSAEVLAGRRLVEIPEGAKYDPAVHGE